MRSLPRLWFGFREPVGRRAYAASGFGLAALKYAGDAALVYAVKGQLWSPVGYLQPFWEDRLQGIGAFSTTFSLALVAWTLPFLWIGASMTLRRARDAGLPAWTGLLFFVPILNYVWMLTLCFLASKPGRRHSEEGLAPIPLTSAVAVAVLVAVVMLSVSVLTLRTYGVGIFLGTPFVMGFLVGFLANRHAVPSLRKTIAAAMGAMLVTFGIFLLFALEGVICLIMALPFSAVLIIIGACLGRSVASSPGLRPAELAGLFLSLPLLLSADLLLPPAPLREVVTTTEVNAPPEVVWPMVVSFPDLGPPTQLAFRLGVAYPIGAHIDGEGPGAVRTCEFSTGPFVEPITAWEPGRRLAFDVFSQPPTLRELSPYEKVHAPHLTDTLRTQRGEFRLIPLEGGRTRLEGSTWYRLELYPQIYWTLWSDALLHQIHRRVLRHIQAEIEGQK